MLKKNPYIDAHTTFAIIGLGVSGKAALRYALGFGAHLLVSDRRDEEALLAQLVALAGDVVVDYEAGGHTFQFLSQADVIFVSPGFADGELLARLRRAGVQVLGELALAAPVLDRPVVAITGTNGKTTVTSLVGDLLRASGKRVFVGGNIGVPLLDLLSSGDEVDVIVLEVSSFQLELAGDFSPHIALLLNLSPDHLDRHGDLAGYRAAKMHLFQKQGMTDIAIVSGDDPLCLLSDGCGEASRYLFGFSAASDISVAAGHFEFDFAGQREIYSLRDSALDNRTGWLNAAPAAFIARSLACAKADIERGIAAFTLDAHRMEPVASIAGVQYYNDSKATNTGAVISALQQLVRVILIAGGRDKGDNYRLLREAVAGHVRTLICIGEATPLLVAALEDVVQVYRATSLAEAVSLAASFAEEGDSVLLSPACASFDMFANYQDRGEQFRRQVLQLQDVGSK
ncbi:UDP-N-acetylmuramoyl-L-alanine--D-glutamate ligase [Desulfotalea psychrophila]|uniref:UDP-N-acetylmuramoylalanine--D-glutamate ligase n=1 Tax=Desulfotalea psychrophila (strain LSv54 / DSM 12343) TaxID=177439 RepID=MURD_DESPS|nr:UDP-N-acetylmuramoyl-L-alanine--D-glutamate ligase [Desulfotalea psychrophila]Q6AJ52.1 RecName: Full=UDP-N-acetylmuramoylalanine--D-glutamate ligase; AltName: Full=D-glutamic acid-adding enzyme; AltName: Full=UDP-N-acetylmuramoyl-L-alanyl-D-glutamate synthetase [Desulfotalea psychrophila LSv54]CAG37628.1 related to UDP-N-acetylmuramoylalanine-D-glutamate ligase [Desulfotalea psychrophila LSv54]